MIRQDQGLATVDQFKTGAPKQIYSRALTLGLYTADNSEDPGYCAQQWMMNGVPGRNYLSFQPLLLFPDLSSPSSLRQKHRLCPPSFSSAPRHPPNHILAAGLSQ